MQQKNMSQSLAIALATLLAVALPALAKHAGATEADSPLVDLVLTDGMTREELVSLYETLAGDGFEPPDCVAGQEMFDDVLASNPFCPWIEELARRGITGGCGGGNFCPNAVVSRAQMAVFVVRAIEANTSLAAVVTGGGSQQIPSGGSGTILSSLSTTFDNGDFHQGTQAHLTVPRTGVYQISGRMSLASPAAAGDLRWCVRRNGFAPGGTCITIRHPSSGSLGLNLPLAQTLLLEAGDQLDVLIQHTTGGNILPNVFWGISLVTEE